MYLSYLKQFGKHFSVACVEFKIFKDIKIKIDIVSVKNIWKQVVLS